MNNKQTMESSNNQSHQEDNVPILTQTSASEADNEKCALRVCQLQQGKKFECLAKDCKQVLHRECYEQHIMAKMNLHPLPGNVIACTKAHHTAILHGDTNKGKFIDDY